MSVFFQQLIQTNETLQNTLVGAMAPRAAEVAVSAQQAQVLDQKLEEYGNAMIDLVELFFKSRKDALQVVFDAFLPPPGKWAPWAAIDASL